MYALYNAFLAIFSALTAPWWLWKLATSKKHREGIRERLGKVPGHLERIDNKLIWVHAVSVGEVLAISRLISELHRECPEKRVVISTTTATGQKLARERFGRENVFYFPLDFGFAIRPFLNALRPELVILAETEFWPNFIHMAKSEGARIAIVNARISDRSLPGYRRWRRWTTFVLNNVDLFLTQTEEDGRRLVEIGAHRERVQVAGNLKFDLQPPRESEIVKQLRMAIQRESVGPVIVAGSTMRGEEERLLNAFQDVLQQFPRSLLVLAPRHPERFSEVSGLAEKFGKMIRRTEWNSSSAIAGTIFLLDSIGELAACYSLANIAFVGGSLVPTGGHNVLEPACFGKAILVGPHTENFREMVEIFRRERAIRVTSAAELTSDLIALLKNSSEQETLGTAAKGVIEQNRGATERTLAALRPLIATKRQPEPELAHAERLP